MQVDIALDAREIYDSGKVERIVFVQVNPELRRIRHWILVTIDLLVILVGHIGRFANPCRFGVVDYVIFVRIYIFAILPLLLLAERDRNR